MPPECPLRVNRVTLAGALSLPVYPCERTLSDRPGMSQTGQKLTSNPPARATGENGRAARLLVTE